MRYFLTEMDCRELDKALYDTNPQLHQTLARRETDRVQSFMRPCSQYPVEHQLLLQRLQLSVILTGTS